MSSFDVKDEASWYHGPMSRQDAADLLMSEKDVGVFLVRDSATIRGNYVLSVKEEGKVSHYIINKIQQNDNVRYKIGEQLFPDLPNLLNFYKLHYLDTTPLIRPAPKKIIKVIGKYDFDGKDQDDLPFKKGEVLVVISKDEEYWWTARNNLGLTGSIPVPYVQLLEDNFHPTEFNQVNLNSPSNNSISPEQGKPKIKTERKLPAYAKVKQARVPNAYDKTALKLEVGDIIKVTRINMNGQWDGELNGKTGHFPFTHVEFLDSENGEDVGS